MSIMGIGIDYQQVIKGLVLLAAVIFRCVQQEQTELNQKEKPAAGKD